MADRRSWLKDAWNDLATACGFRRGGVVGGASSELRLAVVLHLPDDRRQVVGYLTREGGEFVFRYDPSFARSGGLPPIPEFPKVDEVYRSDHLWAFFEARLPPTDREDIRAILERADGQAPSRDVLKVLGQVSRRTVASPYELEVTSPSGAK